jgi:hypothetical protein
MAQSFAQHAISETVCPYTKRPRAKEKERARAGGGSIGRGATGQSSAQCISPSLPPSLPKVHMHKEERKESRNIKSLFHSTTAVIRKARLLVHSVPIPSRRRRPVLSALRRRRRRRRRRRAPGRAPLVRLLGDLRQVGLQGFVLL